MLHLQTFALQLVTFKTMQSPFCVGYQGRSEGRHSNRNENWLENLGSLTNQGGGLEREITF